MSFIIITFSFSYLVGGLFSAGVTSITSELPGLMFVYLPRLLVVAGPAVGAITVAYVTAGNIGLRKLLQKLRPRKRDVGGYVLIPILGTTITFTSFVIGGLSVNRLVGILADHWAWLFGHLAIQGLVVGIGEELGWRGWLMPALTARYRLAASMLLIFLIWGAWHFPILLMGPDVVVPWIMVIMSATIVLSWIWLKTNGNVFILAVAHASINGAQFFLEHQIGPGEEALILESWRINGYLYLMVGGVFLVFMRKHLLKKVPAPT